MRRGCGGNEAVLKSLETEPWINHSGCIDARARWPSAAKKNQSSPAKSPVLISRRSESELSEIAQSVGAQESSGRLNSSEVLLQAVDALLAGETFFP